MDTRARAVQAQPAPPNAGTKQVALKPFGVLEIFVSAEDQRGGAGANFLVEWAADGPISEPVIETVMVGTAYSSTSYSFVSQGRNLQAVR